jgi:transposase InsO family protein
MKAVARSHIWWPKLDYDIRTVFVRYGLPESIVSNSSPPPPPPLQSAEYERFLKLIGFQRILVAPYRSSSNGQAERFVQNFKHFMLLLIQRTLAQLQWKIQNIVLTYRSTPHATTR